MPSTLHEPIAALPPSSHEGSPTCGGVSDSVIETIGRTPVLRLNRIASHFRLGGRLLAKLEHLSPGSSKKDRVALQMVRDAISSGALRNNQPVIEITSGNTGTGLAIVCQALGHEFYAVMSEGNTRERAQMMRAFGAHVVLVPQAPGSERGRTSSADMVLVRARADALARDLGAFCTDQFSNPSNALAHELTTGPELWNQCAGELDAIVGFPGSGGVLGGLGRFLRRVNPSLRIYAVEPAAAASLVHACCSDASHVIQGGGYGKERLTQLEGVSIDGYLECTDEQCVNMTRMLAASEGILAGFSTGAQLHAAVELLRDREAGKSIAFLVCDSGMKYLSTTLFE